MSKVGRNMLWLLASQLATWAASLVTVIVAPDLLGSADFGALSYAQGFVMFFTLVAGLGTSTLLSRAIARDEELAGPYVWNGIVLKVVLGSACAVAAVSLAYALGNRGETLTLIVILSGGMIAHVIGEVAAGALFGLQRMAGVSFWLVIQVYLQTVLGVLVLVLGGGVVAYGLVLTGSALLPVFAQLWLIAPQVRGHLHLDRAIWRLLLTGGVPLMALAFFNVIYGTVNVPILHFIAGEQQVGWYSLAARWVGIPVFITTAVSAAYFPEFAKHGRSLSPEFAPLVNRAIGIVLLVVTPGAVGIALVADDLIRLLYSDGEFERSIVLIRILAIQMPITAMDTLLAHALVASDRLNRYLAVSAGAAVLNPIACVVTIQLMQERYGNGAIGTALVMVATELFVMFGAWRLRSSGVVDGAVLRHVGRIVLASAAMAAVVLVLRDRHLVVQIAAGAATYAIAAPAFGAVSLREIRDVRERVLKRAPSEV
ncbi:MAG: flippase [Ilumatobacter sp.]|nr:flippase [Ilumatobacter sp.]